MGYVLSHNVCMVTWVVMLDIMLSHLWHWLVETIFRICQIIYRCPSDLPYYSLSCETSFCALNPPTLYMLQWCPLSSSFSPLHFIYLFYKITDLCWPLGPIIWSWLIMSFFWNRKLARRSWRRWCSWSCQKHIKCEDSVLLLKQFL